jgi:hypothetical protein
MVVEPRTGEVAFVPPLDWTDWVSPGRTRNWMNEDPLLDWLHLHGRGKGYVPDTDEPGFDERTDFLTFVLAQGLAFEAGVMRCLADELGRRGIAAPVTIGTEAAHSRSAAHAQATIEAMREATPVIAQAVLWDPDERLYGVADLLVRSDVLAMLFPDDLPLEAARGPGRGAPGIGLDDRHYRVVDIKYKGLELGRDGAAGSEIKAYTAQVWLYNRMLGRLTGFTPPAAFLLGRSWTQGSGARARRGESCLERLARVDDDRVLGRDGTDVPLGTLAREAVAWIRRVRTEGAGWDALPVPSVPELRPNLRHTRDQPWHRAKRRIAEVLEDLTILPRVSPSARDRALALGITTWRDPRITPEALGIPGDAYRAQFRRVLEANQAPAPLVLPVAPLHGVDDLWRRPAPFECYADFETVNNLGDDFARLPVAGGQPLIFQVGCGHWGLPRDGEAPGPGPGGSHWRFSQWTADRLDVASERDVLEAWIAHLAERARGAGVAVEDGRVFHWSAAEPVNLSSAYHNARDRHPDVAWPAEPPWYDLLTRVARAAPLGVTGAFGFGLKAIARGLHAQGHVRTVWGDGPADGMGAMVGAWWCDAEARRTGGSMRALELMDEICAYNEVDCRTMAEVLDWLRRER